jgi:hypothetical protein
LREYHGKVSRRCGRCGVEIEVVRPWRAVVKGMPSSERRAYAVEIRQQVLWEALCDGPAGCRRWWAELVYKAEHGFDATLPESRRPVESRETKTIDTPGS